MVCFGSEYWKEDNAKTRQSATVTFNRWRSLRETQKEAAAWLLRVAWEHLNNEPIVAQT